MTGPSERQRQLPRIARWLLRRSPVPPETQAEVQGDLHELFDERRHTRGIAYAHWRLYHDVISLWLERRPSIRTAAPAFTLARLPGAAFALLRDARADVRYAARLFARQPAILLLTVVGLSLGLGIATAAFTVMNAAMRGEGLVDPDGAPGVVRTTDRATWTSWSYTEFLHLREGAKRMQVEAVLTDAALVRTTTSKSEAPSTAVAFVSGGFFAATGGRMMAGRPLDTADEQRAGEPPVVVSFNFWTSRLNRDPAAVGRTIRIGRTSATIVGVAERGFTLPNNRLLWMPLTAYGAVYDVAPVKRTPDTSVQVFARLLPELTLSEAEAQLTGVAAALPRDAMAPESALRVRLDPGAGLGRVSRLETLAIVTFVFAAIGLVLLLACANVATLLIATAITREREMGMRAALGASRLRIVRQLVTESLAFGTVAGAIGLMLAYWAVPTIGRMIEAPAGVDLAPDLNVYLFLGIVTLLTGVGAGLAPAWHGRGTDLVTPLKGEGAGQNKVTPRRLRSLLVLTQAAVSVLLIVIATLFVRATFRAATIDVGFEPAGLYAISPGLGEALDDGGARIRSFWARAIPDVQTVPGISAITLAELTPFGGLTRASVSGEGPAAVVTHFNRTRADYFETLGLRILAGRTFTRDEVAARAPVVLVSESLARIYWHDRSPVGEMLPRVIPIPPTMNTPAKPSVTSPRPVVIGVVADAITAQLHERSTLVVYEPLDPASEGSAQLLIRVAPGRTGVIDEVSRRLRSIDPQADVLIASVNALVHEEMDRPRMLATLTGVVGVVAIVLCVIGLYGLTASLVGQRTREMGVRVAMGAEPRDLVRLLMRDSLRPVMIGLAVGAGAALLAGRAVGAAMFFGVSPHDPLAYGGASLILLMAATLAVLVPTRRAAAVDAALVLRR